MFFRLTCTANAYKAEPVMYKDVIKKSLLKSQTQYKTFED